MPSFCPNCGKDITEKVKFCPDCGADISSFLKKSDETKNIGEKKLDTKTENNVSDERKPKNKNFLKNILIYFCTAIGFIVVLIIISAFIAGMIAGFHSSPSQNVTITQVPSTSAYVVPTSTPTSSLTKSDYQLCIEKYAGTNYDPHQKCENIDVATLGVTTLGPLQSVSPIPTIRYIQPVGTTPSQYATRAESTAQAIDWKSSIVHNFAIQQVQKSSSGDYSINQICDVWESIFNQWTYVSDPPTFNYYTPASDSIKNGLKGNCLDYAILNAAVIQSIGGSTRVVTASDANGVGHAYAEVYLTQNKAEVQQMADYICTRYKCQSINYHEFKNTQGNTEYWLNLDWQSRYPGGKYFNDNGHYQVFYPNGYYAVL